MKALSTPSLCALAGALVLASAACDKTPEPTPTPGTTASAAPKPAESAAAPAPVPTPMASGPLASTVHPDLLDPSKFSAQAPAVFQAKFTSSKGDFVIEVHRDWSPAGADRFYNLVKGGFFDDTRFFRAVDGFMVQFGISGDPAVSAKWRGASIPDDPPGKQSNRRGYVTFAKTNEPNSRTTQIFINYGDNSRLDASGFTPFGQVVKGMDVVDSIYKGYGEGAPQGQGPNQSIIQSRGNAYLDNGYPKLDGVKKAELLPGK